jgi:hypothetical protein
MAGPGLRGCSCALQKEATAAWTALTHLVQVSFPSPPPSWIGSLAMVLEAPCL